MFNIKQCQYEPVHVLVAPRKQQLVNLGMDYKISSSSWLKTEVASSNNDVNTFSAKDDGDDRGWAAKIQLGNEKSIPTSRRLQIATELDYEYVQQKFRPLERLRNVEFSRDWGLDLQAVPEPADEIF